MKPVQSSKKNGYQSDDDTVRYKINTKYFNNNSGKSPTRAKKNVEDDEDNIRYKFPTVLSKPKPEIKPKPKIKVNFWSTKQSGSRLHNAEKEKQKSSRRHIVGVPEITENNKPKPTVVKLRKRVSFLPSPVISDNHVPMVTVPDDLTIQFNEEEANVLREDLNQAFVNSDSSVNEKKTAAVNARKPTTSLNQTNPRGSKRKRSLEDLDSRSHGSDSELEFFAKYVVQKLRRMETNQRIYSENLINTVLMLGQLSKLNGKSKIAEAQ